MGTLRFALALSVVMLHAGCPSVFGSGQTAVQIFFLISGFLISYVLNKETAYRSPLVFYVNRALRIYPVYLVVALATLVTWVIFTDRPAQFFELNPAARISVALANLVLFGQDWIMFLQQSGNGLAFAADFRLTDPQLWRFLLVPPAWSIGLELTFYVLAPFILRNSRLTLFLACLSLALRVIGWKLGLRFDPWTYRFFPFELSLFLIGALVERHLLPRMRGIDSAWLGGLTLAAIALFGVIPYLPIQDPGRSALVLSLMALLLPALFLFQHGRPLDFAIGDLSYPLYICHWLVIWFATRAQAHLHFSDLTRAVVTVALSVFVAYAIEYTVSTPIERVRLRIRGGKQSVGFASARETARL